MASIHFICPVCRQSLKVSAALAGRKGRCPFCSAKVRIPAEDHGTAEILDDAAKQGGSNVAPVSQAEAPAKGLKGAGDMLPSLATGPGGIHADDGIPSMRPRGEPPPGGDDLQSLLDRQLGDAPAEHAHNHDSATLKYGQEPKPPLVLLSKTVLEPPPTPPAADPVAPHTPPEFSDLHPPDSAPAAPAAPADNTPPPDLPDLPDLPKVPNVPIKGETLKYSPENNPVRNSDAVRRPTPGFVDPTPHRTHDTDGNDAPGMRTTSITPPNSLALPPPSERGEGFTTVESTDPAAAIPPLPTAGAGAGDGLSAAARTAALDDMLSVQSENKVGDGLANLPREKTRPTSAVANPGSLPPAPAQAPVPAVANATLQAAALPSHALAGSLIGDPCDPSRKGTSAAPLVVWVLLVVLTLGGLSGWLVTQALERRTAAIQSSQAFLRLSDLAVAEREFFAQPHRPAPLPAAPAPVASLPIAAPATPPDTATPDITLAPAPAATTAAPATEPAAKPESAPAPAPHSGEYALTLTELQEHGLLNPALWQNGVLPASPNPQLEPRTLPDPVQPLATANGYRYVLWFKRQSASGAEAIDYRHGDRLTRGFAVAAIPDAAANWAFAIDDRGRMIQWWYRPPAANKPNPNGANDPVAAGAYPADSDFDKIPIR